MNYVVQHALDNVWAEDIQDQDYYIRPTRITPNGGSLRYAEVGMANLALPNSKIEGSRTFYHVYQIGQIPTHVLGVDIVENKWVQIDKIAKDMECYVNVCLDNGHVVPRSKCFLLRMWPTKNVVLAVENTPGASYGYTKEIDPFTNSLKQVPSTLNNQELFISFYTNARIFATDRRDDAVNADNQMYFETGFFDSGALARIKANKNNSQVPQGWFVINGLIANYNHVVNNFSSLQNKEISIYRDETIKKIAYFRLQDIPTFISKKDNNVKKYIVNLPTPEDELVFHDDVEYFLGRYSGSRFQGLCIPTLRVNPITTVTNKTHAFRTDVITDLINKNEWLKGKNDIHLMVVVRQGGMLRGLPHQNTRIEKLFKLPEDIISSVMTGTNSLMDSWTARNLEDDEYAKIVSGKHDSIVTDLVFKAYGYNAITRYHHPNPLLVENYTTTPDGQSWYNVQLSNVASEMNPLLGVNNHNIEVIEYDEQGLFIGRKRTPYGNAGLFISTQQNDRPVKLIEHYITSVNRSDLLLNEIFTSTYSSNDLEAFGFSAYISTNFSSTHPKWINVTDVDAYYYLDYEVRTDGSKIRRFNWNASNLAEINAVGMIRVNNLSSFKSFDVSTLVTGNRSFPVLRIPNNNRSKVQVEPGSIDLWLEDRLLIEDIDYVVKWPLIYIGRRMNDLATARLHVRLGGLADIDSKHDKPREIGFVKNGIVSVNNHYDIRNDRNIQINIGGSLKHRDEVSFDEARAEPHPFDGRPYAIRDYITPIELYTNFETMNEKRKSEAIDTQTMAYLNDYLETQPINTPVINHTRWHIVSVFLDDVIASLRSGWLSSELYDGWSAHEISEWMESKLYLLEVDISYFDNTDKGYIRLLPHGFKQHINLTEKQYMFLEQVCDIYLKDKVQLNHLITIELGV